MCTNKNNFAARETQYYAGEALLGKTTADIVTVKAEQYRIVFPDAVSGWSKDFNKITALRVLYVDVKNRELGLSRGHAEVSVRPSCGPAFDNLGVG